ncbi:MAG: hypothetical protein LBG60_05655 [Bifidobacteriaceae bacterium]|nr:hypothetical protein [Bifidobacteriaceae bacterium]
MTISALALTPWQSGHLLGIEVLGHDCPGCGKEILASPGRELTGKRWPPVFEPS